MIYLAIYLIIGILFAIYLTKLFRVDYDFSFMFWSTIMWLPLALITVITLTVIFIFRHLPMPQIKK